MRSEFRLTTAFRNGGTRVDGLYCTAPFKLMHPFARGPHTDVMVSFVGPGFLRGDEARMACAFGPGTDTTVRSQSYEKVLDTADGMALRTIDLTVRGDARTVFLPFPVIPFRGSAFRNSVTARIGPRTAFAYADVVTAGRIGMGERWLMRRYDSRVRVLVDDALDGTGGETGGASDDASVGTSDRGTDGGTDGVPSDAATSSARLAFAERMLLDPSRFRHTGMSMWRDYTHCGMLYVHLPESPVTSGADEALGPGEAESRAATSVAYSDPASPASSADADVTPALPAVPAAYADPARQTAREARDDGLIARLRALAEDRRFPGEFGATRARDGVVVRVLARRGDDAFDILREAASLAIPPRR